MAELTTAEQIAQRAFDLNLLDERQLQDIWGAFGRRNVPVDEHDPSKGRRFVDVTQKAGLLAGVAWATSAAWADLDGDGYPDLYVCQYVDWSFENHPACSYDGKISDVCPPKSFAGLPHKVFRNRGDGTFADVSKEAGLRGGDLHDGGAEARIFMQHS